jgi:hypothetical protein
VTGKGALQAHGFARPVVNRHSLNKYVQTQTCLGLGLV